MTEQPTNEPMTPEERCTKWAPMVEDLEPGADSTLICFVLEEEVRSLCALRDSGVVYSYGVQQLIFPTIRRALAYYRPQADSETTLRNLVTRANTEVGAAMIEMGHELPSLPLTYMSDLQDRICKASGLYLTTILPEAKHVD